MTDEQVNDSGDMSDNADEMIDDEGVVVAEDEVNVIAIEMAEAEGSTESSDEAESEEQPSIPELTGIGSGDYDCWRACQCVTFVAVIPSQ